MRQKRAPYESGRDKIVWTEQHLPMLRSLREEFSRTCPFAEKTIGVCLHIEPKTAVMCGVFQAGGARVALTGSPGTTQDDVAAALAEEGHAVYGRRSDGKKEHSENIRSVLSHNPDLLLDNGADLVAALLQMTAPSAVIGGTEETTTGAMRLREELGNDIAFPVIVINDSPLKRIIENEHGVGQTVVASFMEMTNLMVPAKRFVIMGYGWCGRGIARCLKGLGARVAVVEPDPLRALEAAMDGMIVKPLDDLLGWGSVFITVTGRPGILREEHFASLSDGAILANAGHFSWEIELDRLRAAAVSTERLDEQIERFTFSDGRGLSLLAGGEMLNLAGGGGNPAETMDMGLSLQVRSLELLAGTREGLVTGPQPVPQEINNRVAKLMLQALAGPHGR